MTGPVLLSLIGLVALTAGAELLVRGAGRLARALGLPPLVIGLTVVAYGTSAPELAVSIGASASGEAEIAIGNVVGSNIFNVLFILGACGLILPLRVSQRLIRLDVPLMIGASVVAGVLATRGGLGRVEGLALTLALVGYTVLLVRLGRRDHAATGGSEEESTGGGLTRAVVAAIVGLVLLVIGARAFVDGATDVARTFGVSELVIGLTIVAAGTSMPEVATSVVASLRGERDIAVGNVVGSNTFNILGVLGLSAALSPAGLTVPLALQAFDVPIMVAVALLCLPVFFTRGLIERWEAACLLGLYVGYVVVLLSASDPATAAAELTAKRGWLIGPAVLLAAVTVFLAWRRSRGTETQDGTSP